MTDTVRRLADLEEFPELYLIENERKLELAKQFKATGVMLFREGKITDAFFQFSDALKLLVILDDKGFSEVTTEMLAEKDQLLLQLYSNLAGCQVQRQNWEYVVDLCDSALMLDEKNVKCLYRRGWALMELQDFERAQADFAAALEVDPTNTAVTTKRAELVKKMKALNVQYAEAMKKMFS